MKSMSNNMELSNTAGAMPMSRRKWIVFGVTAVALICGWLLFRPELLFINQKVNESFPGAVATAANSRGMARALASGMFHSVAHETKGLATIHQLADGKRVVRLTDFETSNGPDVHLFLVAAADASDNDAVKNAGYVDLGSLKGNIGDQNYDVPSDVDLSRYQSVTVWCNRFGVNFGTAPLAASTGDMTTGSEAAPTALVSGMFHSVAHETKGTATIFRLADKERVLRLTGFETSNGPDVRVYLIAAPDAGDSETVKSAGFVELGKLKGNIGDQNYDVPSELDLNKYQAVTIWCNRFGVNFGTAPLR